MQPKSPKFSNLNQYNIGIDIGGSHISCGVVDVLSGKTIKESIKSIDINPHGNARELLDPLAELLRETISTYRSNGIGGIGISMPGPFDYKRGISRIAGVQKFDSIFGIDLKSAVVNMLNGDKMSVVFENDAACFALGEYFSGAAKSSNKSIVVTLGTGFGSTYLVGNRVQTEANEIIPPAGYLYHIPFGETIADDYFSTRWFVTRWKEKTGNDVVGVKEIADRAKQNDSDATALFEEFTTNLAEFIFPWLDKFKPDVFVLGGSIAKSSDLFLPQLIEKLKTKGLKNVMNNPRAEPRGIKTKGFFCFRPRGSGY